MKPVCLLLPIAAVLAWTPVVLSAQTPGVKLPPRVSFVTTNSQVYVATNLPSFLIPTNLYRSGPVFGDVPARNLRLPSALAPGIYKTEPYTCIVVVPGGHPDDKMIYPRGTQPYMPTVQPDLRFIPLKPVDLAAKGPSQPDSASPKK
jgi:hypothetical protein